MSGLKLGDLILDSRRVLYIPSLRAVVCAGLHEALGVSISEGLRHVLETVDSALEEYKPESLIVLGRLHQESALAGLARRWGKKVKLQLVAVAPDADARAMAEALGCEVHQELLWGRYRFVEKDEDGSLDVHFLTIAGTPHYGVRVGGSKFAASFTGVKLPVFLKGLGRLTLPSMNPASAVTSVFKAGVDRCDVFAIGHQRVLPMGKVADLKPVRGIGRGLPISKATLGGKRKAPKEPSAD